MDTVALALPVMIALVVVALAFDFLNGLHDAANSIATIVSTRVLRPQHAVVWAAFFNFVAFGIFGAHVAQTVGTGIVSADIVDPRVVFGALTGAIAWNIITWALGIPSSSSHALIGGLVGAGVAKVGVKAIVWGGLGKTTAAIVLSPLCGFVLAMLLVLLCSWLFARYTPFAVDRLFRTLQFVSASLYSIGHGGNDAQKTMGIITVLLYSQGYLDGEFHVPFWVMLACYAAMGLGTLIGGWRIVRTMGSRITRLTPFQGFCAETGGAITLFAATELGIPVSTTHTITGCIVRVGSRRCAGTWRTTSSWPGSSRSRPPPSSRQSPTRWWGCSSRAGAWGLIWLTVIPGRRVCGEPGIYNPDRRVWIPGPRAKARVPE
jgi:PiT family inorganic phosphate transporter